MGLFHRWAKRLLWPGLDLGTRARLRLRRRFLREPGVRTLDVGCGNGCMTLAAARVGQQALGIALDGDAIERAAQYGQFIGVSEDRCRFVCADLFDLPAAEVGVFDQVVMFEVLEHIVRDSDALAHVYSLMRCNGWLHVSVPKRDSHVHFEGVSRVEDGSHVRHGYSREGIERLIRDAGFEPVDRLGVGGLGTVLGFLAVAYTQKLPGMLGAGAGAVVFLLAWPISFVLNLVPIEPWSHYVLAVKRPDSPT